MTRYRFLVEYNGAPYFGWQRQESHPSVQGALEDALKRLGETNPLVQGSGRTDAGVHAWGQVAHADLERPWKPFRIMEALNAQLREAGDLIAVLDCTVVDDAFHARFSAIQRRYVYRIVCRRAPLTLDRGLAWNVKGMLDTNAMNQAATLLLGEHDFTTFRSTECQAKSPVKTLDTLDVSTRDLPGGPVVEISTTARSYLHNQVRSLAGSLKHVGEGKWGADDLKQALEAKDRRACGTVAPAHGLYLVSVAY